MASKRPIPSFLIFQDKEQRWRWNYLGANGRIIAMGAETYAQQQGCIRAIRTFMASGEAPVLVRNGAPAGAPPAARPAPGSPAEEGMLELTPAQIVEETN